MNGNTRAFSTSGVAWEAHLGLIAMVVHGSSLHCESKKGRWKYATHKELTETETDQNALLLLDEKEEGGVAGQAA